MLLLILFIEFVLSLIIIFVGSLGFVLVSFPDFVFNDFDFFDFDLDLFVFDLDLGLDVVFYNSRLAEG